MAPRLVARLGRRKAAWEKSNPREIAEVEFQDSATGGLDLRPSVYVLDGDASNQRPLLVRVRSEHSASCLSPPRPGQSTLELDVEGATSAQIEPSPGETKFEFANSVHAELLLESADELVALIARLLTERAARIIAVTGREVLAYVDGRLGAGDSELIAVIGSPDAEHGDWFDAVVRFRGRTPQ